MNAALNTDLSTRDKDHVLPLWKFHTFVRRKIPLLLLGLARPPDEAGVSGRLDMDPSLLGGAAKSQGVTERSRRVWEGWRLGFEAACRSVCAAGDWGTSILTGTWNG